MFNMSTLIKEHAKLVKSIKDLESEVQTLTVDYLELKDMVEALEKKIV
jgi:predicted RNA-binding protein with EMAP domain